ncbi:RNA polymerase sigma factor [Pseudoflavitalea rhizosphaerae]|uniref:RNA polymerase sigma factor n=1 Tax=Pseudoflavitalea rhizosphaerae TaxID=1884793 RepID=UPI000F8D7FF9|nr:RNA polymerase sigma-70 factor [Pseudoflavitalea rhizosphaerae]
MLAPNPHNEASLLLQVAEGDQKAFATLFHAYHHRLGIYLYQLTSSKTFAEENIQDIFCKVWEKRAQLPEIQNFQHWLFAVSKNHALNVLRKMVRERAEQLNWEKQQLNLPPDAELTTEERIQLLHKAISQLPPQQKKVFILSRYQRLKYVEIARELNLSRETVKSYLQIATSSIRKYVNTHLPLFIFLFIRFFH